MITRRGFVKAAGAVAAAVPLGGFVPERVSVPTTLQVRLGPKRVKWDFTGNYRYCDDSDVEHYKMKLSVWKDAIALVKDQEGSFVPKGSFWQMELGEFIDLERVVKEGRQYCCYGVRPIYTCYGGGSQAKHRLDPLMVIGVFKPMKWVDLLLMDVERDFSDRYSFPVKDLFAVLSRAREVGILK